MSKNNTSPYSRHMTINMDYIKMRNSGVSHGLSRFGFIFLNIASLSKGVNAQNFARLEFIAFTAYDAFVSSFLAQIFHLLHYRLTSRNLLNKKISNQRFEKSN